MTTVSQRYHNGPPVLHRYCYGHSIVIFRELSRRSAADVLAVAHFLLRFRSGEPDRLGVTAPLHLIWLQICLRLILDLIKINY